MLYRTVNGSSISLLGKRLFISTVNSKKKLSKNLDKNEFYRLLARSESRPAKSSGEASTLRALTFETRKKTDADNADIDKIFGFSGGKNKSLKSSRRDVSYREINKYICGLKVPKRPIEPDNCCMSGCVNCVWELFDEDMGEWKDITQKATERLIAQGDNIKEKWPLHFDAPPANLPDKYIPDELRASKGQEDKRGEMPLGLQVFTNFEKRMKSKNKLKTELSEKGLNSLAGSPLPPSSSSTHSLSAADRPSNRIQDTASK